jgi:hypothetical protein
MRHVLFATAIFLAGSITAEAGSPTAPSLLTTPAAAAPTTNVEPSASPPTLTPDQAQRILALLQGAPIRVTDIQDVWSLEQALMAIAGCKAPEK